MRSDAKITDETTRQRVEFERRFIASFLERFLALLYWNFATPGEVWKLNFLIFYTILFFIIQSNKLLNFVCLAVPRWKTLPNAERDALLVYCERTLELLSDLVSQLPTRRFLVALLDDLHFIQRVRCIAHDLLAAAELPSASDVEQNSTKVTGAALLPGATVYDLARERRDGHLFAQVRRRFGDFGKCSGRELVLDLLTLNNFGSHNSVYYYYN